MGSPRGALRFPRFSLASRRSRCSASPRPRSWDRRACLRAVAGALGALCVFAHDHLRRQEIALLTDSARRDPLTGLLNRRGFEEAFDAELERARRRGSSPSVVVGDLDRFKRVNDALGHPGGDAVLTRSAGSSRAASAA